MASDKQGASSAIAQPETADSNTQDQQKAPENAREASKNAFQQEKEAKQKRTTGLKVFDTVLYHGLTNAVVFTVSVLAVYLTMDKRERKGKKVGKLETFFTKRRESFFNVADKLGYSEKQAEMPAMVFFSFVYGSLMTPFVKLFEDQRSKIAHWIDKRLGTEPKDLSVYEAEPKQSWGSVLGGRIATAAIVIPTAITLSNVKFGKANKSLNYHLFEKPGFEVGKKFVKLFPRSALTKTQDVPKLFEVSFFDAFYTAVCTTGLYFSSRFIAKVTGKKEKDASKPEDAKAELAQRESSTDSRSADQKTPDSDINHSPAPAEEPATKWASATARTPAQQTPQKATDWQTRTLQNSEEPQRALA